MAIFLITAPSGAGKTSVMEYIKRYNLPQSLGECVSHTTRPIREGEKNGITYYYKTKEEFESMVANGEFAELVDYHGHMYGISKAEIERVLDEYKNVYIIVNYDGYRQVKSFYPDAVGIFLYMSKEECMANMLSRGDSKSSAEVRISTYEREMMDRVAFDYVIKNNMGKFYNTCQIITNIIQQYEI